MSEPLDLELEVVVRDRFGCVLFFVVVETGSLAAQGFAFSSCHHFTSPEIIDVHLQLPNF